MFESATIKLTLVYLAILAVICLFFSINWYGVATAELDRQQIGAERVLQRVPNLERDDDGLSEFLDEQDDRIAEAKNNVQLRIIIVNVLLLTIGGIGSYILAKKTLEPIEQAHIAQTRFTADASHELRTPLAAMRSEIEVALRDTKASKQSYKKLFASNLEELDKLTSLSDGLLRLAQQDEAVELSIVDPKEILTSVANRFNVLAKEHNVTISTEATSAPVLAHESSLEELVSILTENAIKYSAKDATVTIVAKRMRTQTEIAVIDTGQGIKASDLPHIFDRFYRADNARTSDQKSYGLGLSIAKDLARLQETTIAVDSKPGEGSKFSFTLKNA